MTMKSIHRFIERWFYVFGLVIFNVFWMVQEPFLMTIDNLKEKEFTPQQPQNEEQHQQQHDQDYTSTSSSPPGGNPSPFRFRASAHALLYPENVEASSLDPNFDKDANSVRNLTTIHITSAQEVQDYRWKHRDIIPLEEPLIFVITATYNSPTKPFSFTGKKRRRTPKEQLAALTTLGQTLLLDGNIYWIVVEDAESCCYNPAIRLLLHRIGLPYAHVYAPTKKPRRKMANHQGIDQRNRALEVVESLLLQSFQNTDDGENNKNSSISHQNNKQLEHHHHHHQQQQQQQQQRQEQQQQALHGIVYFGDDDNTYDVRLFPTLRQTKTIGVLPVGFVAGGGYERCVVNRETGHIMSLASGWRALTRKFPVDMAGIAFSTRYLLSSWWNPNNVTTNKQGNSNPNYNNKNSHNNNNNPIRFHWDWGRGVLETKFVEQLVDNPSQLNPLADNCTKLYVWHTKPKTYNPDGEGHFQFPPNPLATITTTTTTTTACPKKKSIVHHELYDKNGAYSNSNSNNDIFTNGGAAASSRRTLAILPPYPLGNTTTTTAAATTTTMTTTTSTAHDHVNRWDEWNHIAPRIGGISWP